VIGVTGYYGYGNVGDDLLLRHSLEFFGPRNVVVYVPAEKAAGNVRAQFDCSVSTIKFLPADSKQLDLLVFGGGGVLHDSAMLNLWPKRIIEQVKCLIALLGVGTPHGEGFMLASHKIDYIVDKACFVGLRDFESKAIFEQLWDKTCFLFPDFCVGVSLHFGLLALTQGKPFKMLQYQGKVPGVLGLVVDDSRIVYPSKVYNVEELLPVPDFSERELDRLALIKDYLKACLRRIKSFKFDDMPNYPLPVPEIKTRYKFGGVKPKPKILRDLRKTVSKVFS